MSIDDEFEGLMKRASVFRGFSAKAGRKSDCSPLAKAQWQYGKQGQYEAVAINRPHGSGYEMLALSGIKFGVYSFKGQSDLRRRIR